MENLLDYLIITSSFLKVKIILPQIFSSAKA